MERTMTVEEKIRRAEQIYEKRKQGSNKTVATVNVNSDKKDIKLLKKMLIQIAICTLVYLVVYMVQNNNYVFSEEFTKKANEILSYDTNFMEIYNKLKDGTYKILSNMSLINSNNQTQETNEQENSGNSEEQNNEQTTENTQTEESQMSAIGGASDGEQATQQLTQEEQDIVDTKNTTTFIKPVEGSVSSKFGQRDTATGSVPKNHTGTDIAANMGTKIIASTDGEVVLYSEEGDYGKHIKIQIGEVSIIYAHCNNIYVKQGDTVKQGQEIAEVGSTGNSTGPHLHFEIRYKERVLDPQKILEL